MSGLVSYGASEEEIANDDSMSLTASDAVEWCASGEEPEALPSSQSLRLKPDSELIHVLSKAVEDLDLERSAPDESVHGLLDEWFLPVRRQPLSHQWPAPFLPAVYEELTKTWCAPIRPELALPLQQLSPLLTTWRKMAIASSLLWR